MSVFYIKRNDTSPAFQATLTDGAGTALDVSGATIRFHMRDAAGTNKVDAAATAVDATNGIVRYNWQTGDTDTAGTFEAEFEVTYVDTTIETVPNDGHLLVSILEDLA